MRIPIDIPKDQMDALDRIARDDRKSRAAIIREAIAAYVRKER